MNDSGLTKKQLANMREIQVAQGIERWIQANAPVWILRMQHTPFEPFIDRYEELYVQMDVDNWLIHEEGPEEDQPFHGERASMFYYGLSRVYMHMNFVPTAYDPYMSLPWHYEEVDALVEAARKHPTPPTAE